MKVSTCLIVAMTVYVLGPGSVDSCASKSRKECTVGCSTVVRGDGLTVKDNPNGDHHRVITNQGSWGSSSGYQPPNSPGTYRDSSSGYQPPNSPGRNGDNDVKISWPCVGCNVDVQGRGNVVRN